jgi:hypothetical protein
MQNLKIWKNTLKKQKRNQRNKHTTRNLAFSDQNFSDDLKIVANK